MDPEFQSNLKRLQEIFKGEPKEKLKSLLLQEGMSGTVNTLLDDITHSLRNPPVLTTSLPTFDDLPSTSFGARSNSSSGNEGNPILVDPDEGSHFRTTNQGSLSYTECGSSATTLPTLLKAHANKVMDTCSEYTLSVNRTTPEHLWLSAVAFYKGAAILPQKLKKQLVVQFNDTGEIGADGGALRKEFFEDVLKEANARLFEGEDRNRVPKKDCNLEYLFTMAGMLVAHSVKAPDCPALVNLFMPIFRRPAQIYAIPRRRTYRSTYPHMNYCH